MQNKNSSIVQVKQLSCIMQENLIPHDMFHAGNALAIFYTALILSYLKGLGHAILGNFSIDRMVIELTKVS